MSRTHPTPAAAASHLRALVKAALLSAGESPIEANANAVAGAGQKVVRLELDCMTGAGMLKSFDEAMAKLTRSEGLHSLGFRGDFGPVAGIVRLSVSVSGTPEASPLSDD